MKGIGGRDGHAPIFADAHRCASDAHNSHKPHQIVIKINFFDQNIVILDSYFSFLRMDKTKWDEQYLLIFAEIGGENRCGAIYQLLLLPTKL